MSHGLVLVAALLAVAAAAIGIAVGGPIASLAAPGVIGGAIVLFHPLVGLAVLAGAIPMEETFMLGGATVTRLLGMLVAVAWLLHAFIVQRSLRDVLQSPIVLLALVFILYASASILWAEYVPPTRGVLLRLVMFFALAVVALDLVRSWSAFGWIARALVVGGIAAAILTIGQYYGFGVRRAGEGISGGVNATALVLVTVIPIAFYVLRTDNQGWRVAAVLYIGLAIGAVAVTFSRMSYLVLPIILVIEAWGVLRSRRGRLALVALVVILVPAMIKYVPVETVGSRLETVVPYIESTVGAARPGSQRLSGRGYHLLVAWEIFQDNPIVGSGINNYGYQFLQYQHYVMGAERLYTTPRSAHSSYFAILADLGLIGVVLWLGFLAAVAWALRSTHRLAVQAEHPVGQVAVRALSLAFAAQVVYGVYAEIHKEKLFWLIVGLVGAVHLIVLSEVRRLQETASEVRLEQRDADHSPLTASPPRHTVAFTGER